ncbi:unnamed protein product [Vitrella brassicaformis CCMP3155]|uniref:non-specific serine/threonine protein kinase n=3 Tax=Vitrella brassicaformis TaxID=1169539 RepID=A0A0G4ER60_VITBC|nr:unnamed protein product [Vitrella brassicaformis CCMP3155]|eukprot:CEL99746.1 unnamed protein product [Vitrella brassicaformis CCMP3155]
MLPRQAPQSKEPSWADIAKKPPRLPATTLRRAPDSKSEFQASSRPESGPSHPCLSRPLPNGPSFSKDDNIKPDSPPGPRKDPLPAPGCPPYAVRLSRIHGADPETTLPDLLTYLRQLREEIRKAKELLGLNFTTPPVDPPSVAEVEGFIRRCGSGGNQWAENHMPGVEYPEWLLALYMPTVVVGSGGYGGIQLFKRRADAPSSAIPFKNLPFLLVKALAKSTYNNNKAYLIERTKVEYSLQRIVVSPWTCTAYAWEPTRNHGVIIMSFVPALDFEHFIRHCMTLGVPLDASECGLVFLSSAFALDNMHRNHASYHRDFKLENSLIREQEDTTVDQAGRPVTYPRAVGSILIDYGAAKCDELKKNPTVYGTQGMLAPEERFGPRGLRFAKVDGWALGATLLDSLAWTHFRRHDLDQIDRFRFDLNNLLKLHLDDDFTKRPDIPDDYIQKKVDQEINHVEKEYGPLVSDRPLFNALAGIAQRLTPNAVLREVF